MNTFFSNCTLFVVIVVLTTSMRPALSQTFSTCNDFGHFDLSIDVNPPASDNGSIQIDTSTFPVEAGTGKPIVPADLGDFPGGVHKTDDPGWVVSTGSMEDGEVLWFRALDSFRYWDKNQQLWLDASPNDERIRYFGEVPLDVELNGTPEERAFYTGGTIWSSNGLTGPLEAPIEAYVGGIHAHLDFCVEDGDRDGDGVRDGDCTLPASTGTGSPSAGAYLIELQLFSKEVASNGSQQKYLDSQRVKVILNNGLEAGECSAAIGALVIPDTIVDDSPPLPAAGILIMTGP